MVSRSKTSHRVEPRLEPKHKRAPTGQAWPSETGGGSMCAAVEEGAQTSDGSDSVAPLCSSAESILYSKCDENSLDHLVQL